MTENTELIAALYPFVLVANHIVEVTSYNAKDAYGTRALDGSTTRQYQCLLQNNEETRWNTQSATDSFPYVAYILSVPINGSDAVPIRVEEQFTIVEPSYWGPSTPRRLGTVKSYFDQYGFLFCMTATFE